MEKILIIGCKKAMDDVCIGCSRCLVGFNKRAGKFEEYGEDAEIIGLLNCGDCPGATIVTRLAQIKLWNRPHGRKAHKDPPGTVHHGQLSAQGRNHRKNKGQGRD